MKFCLRLVSLTISIVCFLQLSVANSYGSNLNTPPSNLDSYKAKINDSLVAYECGSSQSIGFAGNWQITEAEKNSGINSKIFTSASSLRACGKFDSVFNIQYKGSTFTGKVRHSTLTLPDFGVISSSVIVPALSLWGPTPPNVNSWVGIVRYAPGFGFVWAESKVVAYNPDTVTFAINPTIPLVEKNALVFNNKGEFLGIVSKLGIKAVEGLVLVHGAPLQCPLNKMTSSPGITTCDEGEYAQNIWGTPTSNSKDRLCVQATTGVGYSKVYNFEDQCSESKSWNFEYCSSHPRADLQIFKNKAWRNVQSLTGKKNGCPEKTSPYLYMFSKQTTDKYRIKEYGNRNFQVSYISLKISGNGTN